MMLVEQLDNIKTKEDFVDFVIALMNNFKSNHDEWENWDLESYLESISAWVKDSDKIYYNTGKKVSEPSDWKVVARVLYAGKIYE